MLINDHTNSNKLLIERETFEILERLEILESVEILPYPIYTQDFRHSLFLLWFMLIKDPPTNHCSVLNGSTL